MIDGHVLCGRDATGGNGELARSSDCHPAVVMSWQQLLINLAFQNCTIIVQGMRLELLTRAFMSMTFLKVIVA